MQSRYEYRTDRAMPPGVRFRFDTGPSNGVAATVLNDAGDVIPQPLKPNVYGHIPAVYTETGETLFVRLVNPQGDTVTGDAVTLTAVLNRPGMDIGTRDVLAQLGRVIVAFTHGSNANAPRPTTHDGPETTFTVSWTGAVAPANAQLYDHWHDNGVFKIHDGTAWVATAYPLMRV